jgi:hypothetical protein
MVVLLGGATIWSSARNKPPRIELPEKDLESLPAQLGPWSVTSDTLSEMAPKTGAAAVIERVYRDAPGRQVSAHVAVFDEYFDGRGVVMKHCPDFCYPANGYRIADDKELRLDLGGDAAVAARLLTVERDSQKLCVLFWYQVGDSSFATLDGMRDKIWSMRGKASWPPMVKVMLQISAAEPRVAEGALREIAVPIALWLKDYQ